MEEREIIVLNITRFKRLLETELDERKKKTVMKLLAEAEADLERYDRERRDE